MKEKNRVDKLISYSIGLLIYVPIFAIAYNILGFDRSVILGIAMIMAKLPD